MERQELWSSLEDFNVGVIPWLVAGDCNIIRNDGERIGGRLRAISSMDEFNSCLDGCGFMDIAYSGVGFLGVMARGDPHAVG